MPKKWENFEKTGILEETERKEIEISGVIDGINSLDSNLRTAIVKITSNKFNTEMTKFRDTKELTKSKFLAEIEQRRPFFNQEWFYSEPTITAYLNTDWTTQIGLNYLFASFLTGTRAWAEWF